MIDGPTPTLHDPLLHDVDLPLTATFHPLGFPVEIAANSPHVLEAASEGWSLYQPEFTARPIQLRIVVQPTGDLAPKPVFRSQRHFFSIVSDRDNFAFYDSATLFGYCFVSEKTAAEHDWFRFYFLETMVYMLLAQQHAMQVHAACVATGDSGVLLGGSSGAGKSTLSWACARAGWTYITDDGAWLLPNSDIVLGRCHTVRLRDDAPSLFPELGSFLWRARPSGKVSIEIPVSTFPQIRAASKCRASCVVLLDRRRGVQAHAEPAHEEEVIDVLLRDIPSYGGEVRARYENAVRILLVRPAHRMIYDNLDQAIRLLFQLVSRDESG